MRVETSWAVPAVLAAFSSPCAFGQYIFTEAVSTAWCNNGNWAPPMGEPQQIPPDGAEIVIPAGKSADMFSCPNLPLRVLGEISAEGQVRFWTPVAFAGGGSLTNPLFEFSTDPVAVSGVLTLGGDGTAWAGGIFEGGQLLQTGTMLVTSGAFGGRVYPRVLRSGCVLANNGTMLVTRSFTLGTAGTVQNDGTLRFSANSSILLEAGATGAVVRSPGNIEVDSGVGAGIQPGLEASGPMFINGSLAIQGEGDLGGLIAFGPGGSMFVTTPASGTVRIASTVSGDGTMRLEGGDVDLDGAIVTAGEMLGHGVVFNSAAGVELQETVTVLPPGRVTLGSGRIFGDDSDRPASHLLIAPGGRFEAVSGPGFGGGGDLVSMRMVLEGRGLQQKSIRLLGASRIEMGEQGFYELRQARVDGDAGSAWTFRGHSSLLINDPPFGGNTSWINGVRTRFEGNSRATLHSGILVAQANTPTDLPPIELADTAAIKIPFDGDWRAYGKTAVTGGEPRIEGNGQFTLQTGALLLIAEGATLTVDLESQAGFSQGGSIVDAAPTVLAGGRIINEGRWNWLSGSISLTDSHLPGTPRVVNDGSMEVRSSNGHLRCDLENREYIEMHSNIVLAEQGVEIVNHDNFFLYPGGGVSDLTAAREGRLVNMFTSVIYKSGAGGATINTTLDNRGNVTVGGGTLFLNGPIVQIDNGVLRGGRWRVMMSSTLRTPGQIVQAVAVGGDVAIQGSWPEFMPRINEGRMSIETTVTLPEDFQNFGDMEITSEGKLIGSGGRRYTQQGGTTTIAPGGEMDWPSIDLRAGNLRGSGTITTPRIDNTGGNVTPGSFMTRGPEGAEPAPGVLRVVGNYVQHKQGTLRVEIASDAGPGSEGGHDLLEIEGTGVLGGRLIIELPGGYTPAIGSSYTVVTATAGLSGGFDVVEQPAPVSGVRFGVVHEPGMTRLVATCAADLAPPVGLLDLADITTFLGGFTASDAIADLNGDALFDLADVVAFVASFNAGCP